MKKIIIYSLAAASFLFSACSTDLEVVGNYKETMVVYGLLDQSKTTQYIKINKAFLGEGSAIEFAKIKDSAQFAKPLNVVLKRVKNGVEIASYNLAPDNIPQKNAGIFYGPDQTNSIYSTNTALFVDSEYQLVINNNETGATVSSQTSLVNDFSFIRPIANTAPFGFVSIQNPLLRFYVEWYTSKNARAYQLTIRFNYTDSTISSGNVPKTLDWVFPAQKTNALAGGEPMGNDFVGKDFLRFVGNQLTDYPDLYKRTAGKVDLMVVAAADDLNTFIEVNKPSTGLIQEKPEFTNITNGLGVFSSRYNKPLSTQTSKLLAAVTLDTLACGQFTKKLKFLNANNHVDAQGKPITCP